MGRQIISVVSGRITDEEGELSLGQLCRACALQAETVIAMVEEGILEPRGPRTTRWRFSRRSVLRARAAVRLQRELGLNLPGAAMALELLDELRDLRGRLRRLEAGRPDRGRSVGR